jgi:dolichol-phosphate mannosyltransferase
MLLWNGQHSWASFVFQGPQRWSHAPRFELATLLGHVLLLITPLGVGGFVWGVARSSARRRFGLVFTLVPLAVFVISSLRNETKFNWTGPVWLAALPFMAASVFPSVGAADGWRAGPLQRFWKPTLVSLMLFYGALFHYDVLGWPGAPRPLGPVGKDWRALGREVEEVERLVRTRTGEQPLIVGMDKYNLASELAFYARNGNGADKTTSENLFGRHGLMYNFWFPPDRQLGRSLILVGKDRQALEAPHLARYVARLEPIRELPVREDRAEGRRYFFRVAHGYLGPAHPR